LRRSRSSWLVADLSFSYHHREGITVRNTLLATAVAAALSLSAAQAYAAPAKTATKAELDAMQAQMQALAERLNRLESANAQLQTENSELKSLVDRRDAETDYLKAQAKELREEGAVTTNELSKLKGADWASRIKFKGDLRVRDENIETQRVVVNSTTKLPEVQDAADRNRARFRARFGFDATVTDTVKATFRLASGDSDPRSTNQTFTNIGSGKPIWIDLAYTDWNFMNGGNFVLGKQPYPFFRPGQSMFYDGDFNPEGAAVKFDRGMFFGSAYWWWLQENYNASPSGNNEDANLWGLQAGAKFGLFGGETKVAAMYYDCGACQYNNPFWQPPTGTQSSFGNTTITQGSGTSAIQVLRYDYEVIELSGEMGLTAFNRPLVLFVDWAQNMASDVEYDTAYNLGFVYGKASNPKTWEFGAMWQELDKDALYAQMIDSDFGGGNTDTSGWVLKAGYAPVKNITLNATYFLNEINKDVPPSTTPANTFTGLDYDRLQLDVNYKF
jgi:Tfp pilus assembly protein PilE